jgi:glycosyltransferase involved in cell wall biosynthesis
VLPSISENWGLVVNEAQHAGLPVIVSDRCGCVPELVIDRETGFLVDPESAESIADAMWHAEALGPEGRSAMGRSGRKRVAGQSLERWAQQAAEGVRYAIGSRARRTR